jgi:hypothetical protein
VIPVSHDVVIDAGASTSAAGDYEYVARRPWAVVGLAESRGIARDAARAATDRVADALEACVTERSQHGTVDRGAARIVAQIADDGVVGQTAIRVDPGIGTATTTVLCFLGPVRMLEFPPADAGARGLAIEALWGHPVAATKPGHEPATP